MIPYEWLVQASERIGPFIKETPLTYDGQNDLYLKWENHQITGSFKVRGAFNKVFSLQDWEIEHGLVTASAGNHGQGVALAGKMRGASVKIYASNHAIPNKIQAMRELGAEIQLVPGAYGEAESAGIAYAAATSTIWISPYNDGIVIAGQGTLGLESIKAIPNPSAVNWIVPVGGGGLISGIGSALQELNPRPRLIAVQSEASPFLHAIYHHGTQEGVIELPSLADGLAGKVELGSVTIPMVMNCVTDFILVTEEEIRKAIKYAWFTYNEKIEGSAATSLAAVLSGRVNLKPALVVITGGNINLVEFDHIINDPSI
jgi:threonine dehydratase